MKNDEFILVKIKREYHDILKKYCNKKETKMYAVLHRLIESLCAEASTKLTSGTTGRGLRFSGDKK